MVSTPLPPSPAVLAAFGVLGPAVRLTGGQGTSWQVGEVVLRPGVDPTFQEWVGTAVAGIEQRGFRLPRVLRGDDGRWVIEGWGAQTWVPGEPVHGREADWGSVLDAGRALHAATATLARPSFLDLRTDPWAVADRDAWGEAPRVMAAEFREVVDRLDAVPPPIGRPQLVHGDLTGNVLVTPGEPPSVIDFSPYWRTPTYAEGIAVADALCWQAAPPETVNRLGVPVEAVARGLLFRALTSSRLQRPRPDLRHEADRYLEVLSALGL